MVSDDLLTSAGCLETWIEHPGPASVILRGHALVLADVLYDTVTRLVAQAPFRRMQTPGGRSMSVEMSNCGNLGWVSGPGGYRYQPTDPQNGAAWPAMPEAFLALAGEAAERAGFPGFVPDACLINRYAAGARMGLHQDRDERDLKQAIVSVSLGLPATFLFGGFERAAAVHRIGLRHGDVIVWGGPDRLRYHGILPIREGTHPVTGACRINLTFRKAG